MRKLNYIDLKLIDYKEAWDIQKHFFNLRADDRVNDTLFLLEHPHTYTLGKTADRKHLIGNQDFLNQNNISIYDIDRGGDITYHGPGQIVGYPIISLTDWFQDTHKYLRALEEVIILTCSNYGLIGKRDSKYTGVWIQNRKIAAIGIKVGRWITMHGFAFNVNTDLSLFSGIIPCGIADKDVTSLKRELGSDVDISEVKKLLLQNFMKVFYYNVVNVLPKEYIFSINSHEALVKG
jgi:lipoyl(octanoyl) transferase